MGAPSGHPFFGNQYTSGDYISGTYTYFPGPEPHEISSATHCSAHSHSSDASGGAPTEIPAVSQTEAGASIGVWLTIGLPTIAFVAHRFLSKKGRNKQMSQWLAELETVQS